MQNRSTVTRRELLLRGLAAFAGLGAAPADLWAVLGERSGAKSEFSPLLDWLCDAVIPATDTPGALAAGAPAFVEFAAAHGLRGARPDLLTAFRSAIDALADGDVMALPATDRLAILADVDRRTMSREPDATLSPGLQGWPVLKTLILIAYYTSEAGSTEELQYQLVPGRLDADVPLEPGGRAWANDWTAVKYG